MKRFVLTALLCGTPLLLPAQTDYLNTDRGRPFRIEDALTVERYALELQLSPLRLDRATYGDRWGFEPSLTYGVAALTQIELGLPFVGVRNGHGAFATNLGAVDVSLMRTLRLESEHAPAIALRLGGAFPAGGLGASSPSGTVGAMMTRSFSGPLRLHANYEYTFAAPTAPAGGMELDRWNAGIGVDHPVPLNSTLIGAELFAGRPSHDGATRWNVGVGARTQLTPRWNLDAGVGRSLTGMEVGTHLSVGLTFAFGLEGLVSSRPATLKQPAEQLYFPAQHNWKFRDRYPAADRLFNAFDYGHAILYERLWRDPDASVSVLDRDEFAYIVDTLLVAPPRLALAERAVAPLYARLVPEAMEMFDWAHLLHRQIYDILADDRIADRERDTHVQRALAYYLSRRDLAFSMRPKSMTLMQGQPYSLAFRKKYPKFNGLIWAYHWLQMGLYEPLLVFEAPAARQTGVRAALDHFRALIADSPSHLPSTMPMSPAIAPRFTARYPQIAAIFDNLHSMHDVVSDVLTNPQVPRDRKRAMILAAAAAYRDDTTEVTSIADWKEMSAMMGAEAMGGVPSPAATNDSAFAAVQQRGKLVMGVDQYLSKHTFEDLSDGGRVVLVIDRSDTTGVRLIRDHMRTLAVSMAKGDFSMSATVHAMEVPGTKTMTAHAAAITYRYEELSGGGAVRMTASNDSTALAAIREFLLFQRSDHRTHH